MRRFIAWALICIAVLWLGLTGACTAAFVFQGWQGSYPTGGPPQGESLVALSLMVGAVCMAPGFLFLMIGLFVRPRREAAKETPPSPP